MSHLHFTTKKKYKHLNFDHFSYIQSQYNFFILSNSKNKTIFMKSLATEIGTSLSNLYSIINDGLISVKNYDLTQRIEFSAQKAFQSRKPSIPNNSKFNSVKLFTSLVSDAFFDDSNIESIDEIVNSLKIQFPLLPCVSTKTFYNYIHKGLINIKVHHLPYVLRRKKPKLIKIPKRHKGTSIELRPNHIEDRLEFGHWEGDLIVGGNYKGAGAILTLVERKTRYVISVKLISKSSKQVYMAINKLERKYGVLFKSIFKTITFDNGSEFSRFEDIEKSILNSKDKRTKVYFAHPYASYERGTNENCNKLFRIKIPKGKNILKISPEHIQSITSMINNKRRRILNYKPSFLLFENEIQILIN